MILTSGGVCIIGILGPLISMNLNDNMIVQFISAAFLSILLLSWVAHAFAVGLNTALMPTIGSSWSIVIGNVLFNYTLANSNLGILSNSGPFLGQSVTS